MGPVIVIIHRIARTLGGIDAVHVIHVTVFVIVNAVSGNFPRIDPHLRRQVLVRITDAGVNHRHNDIGGPGRYIPRALRINVRAQHAPFAPAVLQPPQGAVLKLLIRRLKLGIDGVIGLDIFELVGGAQRCNAIQESLSQETFIGRLVPRRGDRGSDRFQHLQSRHQFELPDHLQFLPVEQVGGGLLNLARLALRQNPRGMRCVAADGDILGL
ncbi:MAG: hypothetical protein BWX84_01441 [Verrucomicrobia bacterium ADurb.Bin118]|nr:MAG: hypothetical protein BWX84_01441 [Verrucomicrobia bacterium ADurb.Bin118]